MEAALICVVLAGALLLAWWLPRRRLSRVLAQPLAPSELAIIERNVAQYRGMDAARRSD